MFNLAAKESHRFIKNYVGGGEDTTFQSSGSDQSGHKSQSSDKNLSTSK